ncbi:MAG: class I SAM-dependent methyltransferase [Gammaproteobacteria bacterium]|nr:class I SAM-dependent methyltransferase [Gammaproteobacteria bacterium]
MPDGFIQKFRQRLANGYLNHRFGAHAYPASMLGVLAAWLMPNKRAIIDAGMRNLPVAKAGARLLDMGCGNGAFLLRARKAGWDVVGIDFDVKAVGIARAQGLNVRLGGVNDLDSSTEPFDVITISHVIEHVHYPLEVLRTCYTLLKPGGFLWLETPNIASEGHRLFGKNWLHLDPPRHLVLFTQESMCKTLKVAGFTDTEVQAYRPVCAINFSSSKAVAEGINPFSASREGVSPEVVRSAERVARRGPGRREFITIRAWKP